MASGLAVAGGFTSGDALIHSLVVKGLNLAIKFWLYLGLEDGGPVEDNGKVEKPTRAQKTEKGW